MERLHDHQEEVVLIELLKDENIPNIIKQHPERNHYEKVFLVMALLKLMTKHFEEDVEAKEEGFDKLLKDCENDPKSFTVEKVVEIIGGDESKEARVLRCLDQAIAISGHLHIKDKVCPFLTKDVSSADGWKVLVTLEKDGFVQVCHTRREESIDLSPSKTDFWEIEYQVYMTFDELMEQVTPTKLLVTGFKVGDNINEDLAKYLTQRFNNGKLLVC